MRRGRGDARPRERDSHWNFDIWRDDEDKASEREKGSSALPIVDGAAAANFDVADAVWLRRQLDRWGHCSRDAVLCIVDAAEAREAYIVKKRKHRSSIIDTRTTVRGRASIRCRSHSLARSHGRGSDSGRALQSEALQRPCVAPSSAARPPRLPTIRPRRLCRVRAAHRCQHHRSEPLCPQCRSTRPTVGGRCGICSRRSAWTTKRGFFDASPARVTGRQ